MAWSVKPDGSVDDVAVAEDTLGSDKVARCVMGAVARFRFPKEPRHRPGRVPDGVLALLAAPLESKGRGSRSGPRLYRWEEAGAG